MVTLETLFTRRDYDRLPEGFPAQLIEGVLVREPSPRYGHQEFAAVLRHELVKLVGPRLVPDTPADVGIDDYNVFQPDIVVLAERPPREAHDVGIPILAVEVLSPRTAQRDRHVKTGKLIEAGVGEVWLVEPASETIEVHTKRGSRRFRGDETAASAVVDGFAMAPEALFAE